MKNHLSLQPVALVLLALFSMVNTALLGSKPSLQEIPVNGSSVYFDKRGDSYGFYSSGYGNLLCYDKSGSQRSQDKPCADLNTGLPTGHCCGSTWNCLVNFLCSDPGSGNVSQGTSIQTDGIYGNAPCYSQGLFADGGIPCTAKDNSWCCGTNYACSSDDSMCESESGGAMDDNVSYPNSCADPNSNNCCSSGQTFCYNSQNTGQNNPCCDSDSSCINSQCVKNPIIATITAQNTIQFTTLVTSTIQNTNQFTTTVFTTVNPSAVTIYTTTVIYITSNVFNTFTNQVTSQGAIQTIFSPTITTTYTILVSSTRSVTDAATANKDASVVYVTNVDDSTLTITSTITASQSVTTTSTITTTSGTTVKSTLTVDQILGATKTTTIPTTTTQTILSTTTINVTNIHSNILTGPAISSSNTQSSAQSASASVIGPVPTNSAKSFSTGAIAGVSIAGVAIVLGVVAGLIFFFRGRSRNDAYPNHRAGGIVHTDQHDPSQAVNNEKPAPAVREVISPPPPHYEAPKEIMSTEYRGAELP